MKLWVEEVFVRSLAVGGRAFSVNGLSQGLRQAQAFRQAGSESNVQVDNFERLVALLRNWRSWDGGEQYDFGGMTALLGACLDNLQAFALEEELGELKEFLHAEQRAFLKKLSSQSD